MKEDIHLFANYVVAAWVGTSLVIAARITEKLSRNPIPPVSLEEQKAWKGQRRWMLVAEFAAAPALASIGALAVYFSDYNVIGAFAAGVIAGALGFPFIVRAINRIVSARMDLPEKPNE